MGKHSWVSTVAQKLAVATERDWRHDCRLGYGDQRNLDWAADWRCARNPELDTDHAMVDRITPATTQSDMQYLADEFGLQDEWPVTCEPFCQWVIEDNFSNGRPQWEQVGAQFVPDVTPYEKMKLRLRNAGHSVLGILGSIFGYQTIDECVSDNLFAVYLRNFMDLEATPTLVTDGPNACAE